MTSFWCVCLGGWMDFLFFFSFFLLLSFYFSYNARSAVGFVEMQKHEFGRSDT